MYTLRRSLRNRIFLLTIAAPSGQNKSVMCYKYLPDSVHVPSSEAWSEALSLGKIPLGKSLVTAEPAVMVMALIYTQEDLEPSDLL